MPLQDDGSRALHGLLDLLDALLEGDTAFYGSPDVNHGHHITDGSTRARLAAIKARLEASTSPNPHWDKTPSTKEAS